MKRITIILTVMSALFWAGSGATAAEKQRLAVLDLEAKGGVNKDFAASLTDVIRITIRNYGRYNVMSEWDIKAVMTKEIVIQSMTADCEDNGACFKSLGEQLNSELLVAGSVSKIGDTYILDLKLYDAKGADARIIRAKSDMCSCDQNELLISVQGLAAGVMGEKTKAQLEKEKRIEKDKRLAREKRKKEEERKRLAELEAERRRKEAARRSNFTVDVEPSGATVKILNIKDRYYPGISLIPGDYTVQVEADGYHSARKTVNLPAGQQYSVPIKLKSKGPKVGDVYTDPTTGMEFVFVKGGCYQMGDNFGDGDSDEKPVHRVCVDDFYMGKYEVTQGEYAKVMGNNPSRFKKGDRYPVEVVSWNAAQDFIKKLNRTSSRTFRLPTEAEWEYAARSGGKREKYSGKNSIDQVAWYSKNSGSSTHPVGRKKSNGLGIYDMSGNVWEWCQDWYGENYYSNSPEYNPSGPSSGSSRVDRGGGWISRARNARAAVRIRHDPSYGYSFIGFRLVLVPQGSGS